MNPSQAITTLLAKGLTEADIARLVGANQSTINRIKHGKQPAYPLGKALVDLVARRPRRPHHAPE